MTGKRNEQGQIQEEKTALRREMKKRRAALSADFRKEADSAYLNRLAALPFWKEASLIYGFMSFGTEISTVSLIDRAFSEGKRVCVPKIEAGRMNFYEIHSRLDCVPGYMGIPEPAGNGTPVEEPGLVIVPGLAFDREGYRLGYGGGFYDRLLADERHVTAGICYETQRCPQVIRERHDRKVDYLVTEKNVYRF